MIEITDSELIYLGLTGRKILLNSTQVVEAKGIDSMAIQKINSKMSGYENKAAELAINDLIAVCSGDFRFHSNEFSESNDDFLVKYGILYSYFQQVVSITHCYSELISLIADFTKEPLKVHVAQSHKRLSHSFTDIAFEFYPIKQSFTQSVIKSKLKRWWAFLQKHKPMHSLNTGEMHVAIVCFNTPSDFFVYQKVLNYFRTDNRFRVSVFQIDSGVNSGNSMNLVNFQSDNIHVYNFSEFESSHPRKTNYFRFKEELSKLESLGYYFSADLRYTNELFFSAFDNISKLFKPDIYWYNNTSEIGRCLADVGRFHNIPVACIDYALFSDDFIHMASRIKYNMRFCASEFTSQIWRGKMDPSDEHKIIGLLKLDDYQKQTNSEKHKFTILFASTWGGTNSLYNREKLEIVQALKEYAEEKEFKLIVKLHPVESTDDFKLFQNDLNEGFEIVSHKDSNLEDLLKNCDVVVTQHSSVSADALFFNKPVIYFNLSENEYLKSLIAIKNEDFVFFTNSIENFDTTLRTKLDRLDKSKFEKASDFYLYKTDGNAFRRLIDESVLLIDNLEIK